ncbi:hypothetical protein VE00_10179 [Pseudogymnoascus sp. WSF 3629]|nr:hypothetical protein VE00_10179 [Pseudogymnoascus sp. WSF 3629]
MSDPLSITASVVGITVAALHGTRLLLEDLQQLKDAPKTVKRLVEEVHSVNIALALVQDVEDREWELLSADLAHLLKTTICNCKQACDLFRTDLQRWTRHSEDGQLAWKDRANVGFFKQAQIKSMSEQVSNCRLTINSAVSIANLYISVRHSHITEEIKKTISTTQAEVKGAITTADKQLVVLESKLEDMDLSDDDEAAGSGEGKSETLRQLEGELKAVKVSQKLLTELLSKSQEESVAKVAGNLSPSTTVTFSGQNLGFQAGTINGGVNGISFGGK